jgi:hypothetical protein
MRDKEGRSPGILRGHPDYPVSYQAAHDRVRAAKGSASGYLCADCGKQAEQWSYIHDSPDERWMPDAFGVLRRISGDPANYEPRCRSCHVRYDKSG